jgi:LysM repeat protein
MAAIIDIRTGASLSDPTFADPDGWAPATRPELRVVHGGRSDTGRQLRRVFMVRRVVAAVVLAVLALVVLRVGAGVVSAFTTGSAATSATIDASTAYTVQPGDTLWAVAEGVAPSSDPRAVVDQIVQLNSGDGTLLSADAPLRVGQRLVLPSGLD